MMSKKFWAASAVSASLTDPGFRARGPVLSRLETLEAMAFLTFARLLIACVRFDRWRAALGRQSDTPLQSTADRLDFHLARVTDRAAGHLPFTCLCLPRAMALHWLLWRRRRPSELVIATLPEARRGAPDDLHAWVEKGGKILIGNTNLPYQPIIRLVFANNRPE